MDWGWRYAMVRPDFFRIDYVINPYMDPAAQPDPARAMSQWEDLVARLEHHGASVDVIGQRADAPDMVYAMNLGLALTDAESSRVALSHMRFPQRRMETAAAADWFASTGFAAQWLGVDGIGPHFEAGDAFPLGGSLVVGYGPRTDKGALAQLAARFDLRVRGLHIAHPAMYHLDLALCPLTTETALVCPAAFDAADAVAVLSLIRDPIVLSEAEALTFCANPVVVGSTVVMPACPPRVQREIESRGLTVDVVEVGEFHKGGGSIRCLTNPLDIRIGRDLDAVAGGEVVAGGSFAAVAS